MLRNVHLDTYGYDDHALEAYFINPGKLQSARPRTTMLLNRYAVNFWEKNVSSN